MKGILKQFEDYAVGNGGTFHGWYWCDGTNRPDSRSWFYVAELSATRAEAELALKLKGLE